MKRIKLTERDLINLVRRVVSETELPRPTDLDWDKSHGGSDSSGRRGPTTKKLKKAPVAPSTPAAAPPCTPPNGPGGNGLGIHANTAGASLGTGCCGKCDNLPNPAGPFTPAELTYLGYCAPHCGCC